MPGDIVRANTARRAAQTATCTRRAARRTAPRTCACASVAHGHCDLTVTDARGLPIPGVRVTIAAARSDRNGETDDRGQANFVGMQPGHLPARFDGRHRISFEREVAVRSGQPTELRRDAESRAAAAGGAAAATTGAERTDNHRRCRGAHRHPASRRRSTSSTSSSSANRRDAKHSIACSGNTRTMLITVERSVARTAVPDGTPRTTSSAEKDREDRRARDAARHEQHGLGTARHAASFAKEGNRPLILLSVLGGEPCEQAK